MTEPWQWWTTLEPQSRLLAGLAQLGVGLAVTFFGFRLFRWLLAVTGFAAGAAYGLQLGGAGSGSAPPSAWLLALALGLAGALLLWLLFRVGALVAGAALGAAVATAVTASLPAGTDPQWAWLLLLVGIVLGAFLGARLQRPLVIVATALLGAWTAVVAFAMLLGLPAPDTAVPPALGSELWTLGVPHAWRSGGQLWLVGTLGLALLGLAFQLRDTLKLRNRRV